jgi:predicted enzyme related to lactoylglutathione lyase
MIKEIAVVVYAVTDMARAKKFYGETLRLKPGEPFSENWFEFDVGGAAFAITNNFKIEGPASSVAFEVDDIVQELARLKELEVPFKMEMMEFPTCRLALILDPDGNVVTIHQRNKK